MATRWKGSLAAVDEASGDRRRFADGALETRKLPMFLSWQREESLGHEGSVVVGGIDEFDLDSFDGAGTFFDDVDPDRMPRLAEDVREAMHLASEGVLGLSVTLEPDMEAMIVEKGSDEPFDYALWAAEHDEDEEPELELLVTRARVMGATMAPLSAFAETVGSIELAQDEDDDDQGERDQGDDEDERDDEDRDEEEANADGALVATVIGSTSLPIADTGRSWSGSAATRRMLQQGASTARRGHFYRDPDGDPETAAAYKLPFADVIDGTLTIVPRGVAAATGGRGVGAAGIPDSEKATIRNKICTIYRRIQRKDDSWPECPFSRETSNTCSIDDCGDPVLARGWCNRHYKRWRRNGDPSTASREQSDRGAPQEFLATAAEVDVDECVIWPYATSHNGYPLVQLDGKQVRATRTVLEMNGHPRPSDEHLALHSCDTPTCVNPRHLRWGTQKENIGESMEKGRHSSIRRSKFSRDSESNVDAGLVASLQAQIEETLPKRAFFSDPGLPRPTPVTYTDDGWVLGHIATWGSCHVGIPDTCVTPPASGTDYAWFHRYPIETDEGIVWAGRILAGGDHAALSASLDQTISHYDGQRVAAYVVAGHDDHGIWISGAVQPNLDAHTWNILERRKVSGDWRGTANGLELVDIQALRHNPRPELSEPGFPVQLNLHKGAPTALVACLGPEPGETSTRRPVEIDYDVMAARVVDEFERREAAADAAAVAAHRREKLAALVADEHRAKLARLIN